MEFFRNAKAVRLRNIHNKYLTADEDEESVTQDRDGSSKNARWTVVFRENTDNIIRLKSCYNKYLTASNQPFLLGMTGRKVTQTVPAERLGSSVEWEAVREGKQVKLKTRYGKFLRANGGLPPWRNSVTHDTPHRTSTQDWVFWHVDVVEIQTSVSSNPPPPPQPLLPHSDSLDSDALDYDSLDSDSSYVPSYSSNSLRKTVSSSSDPPPPAQLLSHSDSLDSDSSSVRSFSSKSRSLSRQEANVSVVASEPEARGGEARGGEGRVIYFHIANERGEYDEEEEEFGIQFKGNNVSELRKRLEEVCGLENVAVCTKSPLNGNLYPLRLQLPPNNTTMHVVVVPSSSDGINEFSRAGMSF